MIPGKPAHRPYGIGPKSSPSHGRLQRGDRYRCGGPTESFVRQRDGGSELDCSGKPGRSGDGAEAPEIRDAAAIKLQGWRGNATRSKKW